MIRIERLRKQLMEVHSTMGIDAPVVVEMNDGRRIAIKSVTFESRGTGHDPLAIIQLSDT